MTKIPKKKPADDLEERQTSCKRYFHYYWKN